MKYNHRVVYKKTRIGMRIWFKIVDHSRGPSGSGATGAGDGGCHSGSGSNGAGDGGCHSGSGANGAGDGGCHSGSGKPFSTIIGVV